MLLQILLQSHHLLFIVITEDGQDQFEKTHRNTTTEDYASVTSKLRSAIAYMNPTTHVAPFKLISTQYDITLDVHLSLY